MSEDQESSIAALMDNLLTRLDFDIKHQPPEHLPPIANAVVILNGYRTGVLKGDEKHAQEMAAIRKVNREINKYTKGEQDGGNENRPDVQS